MVGKPLAMDYTLSISAQVVLQVDAFRTIINFPRNTAGALPAAPQWTDPVSQHFQQSRMSNLSRPDAHPQEDDASHSIFSGVNQ